MGNPVTIARQAVMPQLEPHATKTAVARVTKMRTQSTSVSVRRRIEERSSGREIEPNATAAVVNIAARPTTNVPETMKHDAVLLLVCTRARMGLELPTILALLATLRLLAAIETQSRKLVRALVRSGGETAAPSASTLGIGVAVARAAIANRRKIIGSGKI